MRIRDRFLSKNKQLFLSSVDMIRNDRSLADFLPKFPTFSDSDRFVFETLDDALGLVGEAIDSLSGLIRNEVEREKSRLD